MTHNQLHSTTTTTVQVQMSGRTILDSIMHKLPSTRKYYRVNLIVPDNGIPIIEYHQANTSKKPKKSIQFVDLLFADKKHDTNEKFAFSIYTIDKTITFMAQDETTMNEWLSKVRECHANLYPEFKRYDSIFEANLLDKGLAKTMHIQGQYRLALCKESLDLIPVLTAPHLLSKQQQQQLQSNKSTTTTNANITSSTLTETSATTNTSTTTSNNSNNNNSNNNNNNMNSTSHHHLHHLHETSTLPNSYTHHVHSNPLTSNTAITPHNNLPHHLPNHQRFHKRHPLLSSNTIELVLRSIRRCGHTDCNFYIESGRHSQIGEGDLWMALSKKSTARQLHELLLATMKLASTTEDQFLYRAPRSRSGSSSENAHRAQQSRSSSLICLASDPTNTTTSPTSNNNNNNNSLLNNQNNNYSYLNNQIQAAVGMAQQPVTITSTPTVSPITSNTISMLSSSNNNIDEDSGYLPMA